MDTKLVDCSYFQTYLSSFSSLIQFYSRRNGSIGTDIFIITFLRKLKATKFRFLTLNTKKPHHQFFSHKYNVTYKLVRVQSYIHILEAFKQIKFKTKKNIPTKFKKQFRKLQAFSLLKNKYTL